MLLHRVVGQVHLPKWAVVRCTCPKWAVDGEGRWRAWVWRGVEDEASVWPTRGTALSADAASYVTPLVRTYESRYMYTRWSAVKSLRAHETKNKIVGCRHRR